MVFFAGNFARPERVGENLGTVTAIAESESGDLWVGTEKSGLFHFQGRRLLGHYTFENTAGGFVPIRFTRFSLTAKASCGSARIAAPAASILPALLARRFPKAATVISYAPFTNQAAINFTREQIAVCSSNGKKIDRSGEIHIESRLRHR